MTPTWHRTEPREVRPFFRAIDAEGALENSAIRLFESSDFLTDTSFDLEEIDFKRLCPAVKIVVVDPKRWMPGTIGASDLELALVGRQPFLKRSKVVHRSPLTEDMLDLWPLDGADLKWLGGGRNLELTLALCLSNDRRPAPGIPFVGGHWLARKSFVLRPRTVPTLFDLRTRTDEEWVAADYPAKTFYAVEYIGGIDGELDDRASVATVYMHVDAHNRMLASAFGDSLQLALGAEIVSSILVESLKEWEALETVDPASPLATLLNRIGKERPMAISELKVLAGTPALLKATLQDRLSVVAALR